MTKHDIPYGCFNYLTYESDETFDMMSRLFFPLLPAAVTLLLGFTDVVNWEWEAQIMLVVSVWITFFGTGYLWFDMR
jgi:hypothetical protein